MYYYSLDLGDVLSPSPIADCSAAAAYRLSRARDRSITDKLRFTYVRYAHAARTDVETWGSPMWVYRTRAHHTRTVSLAWTLWRGNASPREPALREIYVTRAGEGGRVRVTTTGTALADCGRVSPPGR